MCITSQHQRAREETEEIRKRERWNIQELRPGCNAMQWYCDLCLFFKSIYSIIHTLIVPYCAWSVVLRPLFISRGLIARAVRVSIRFSFHFFI